MSNPANNTPTTLTTHRSPTASADHDDAHKTEAPNAPITDKLDRLNAQIDWFYGEDFSLDQAASKYQEAIALAKDAKTDLENLQNQIEVLSEDFSQN